MENRIKEKLKEKGIKHKDLAEKMGISKVALSQIVNSKMPRVETFERIATLSGIPAWSMLLSDKEISDVAANNAKITKQTSDVSES